MIPHRTCFEMGLPVCAIPDPVSYNVTQRVPQTIETQSTQHRVYADVAGTLFGIPVATDEKRLMIYTPLGCWMRWVHHLPTSNTPNNGQSIRGVSGQSRTMPPIKKRCRMPSGVVSKWFTRTPYRMRSAPRYGNCGVMMITF